MVIREKPSPPKRIAAGPKGGLIGGNIIQFNRDPLGFVSRCVREYGDYVQLHFGNVPIYLFNDPEVIKDVLVTENRAFIKGRGLDRLRLILGNGLLTSEGEFWRRQRRLAQPAFHQKRIHTYGEIMLAYTHRMLEAWKDGGAYDIHQEMMTLTMLIVAKSLFDVDLGHDAHDVRQAVEVGLGQFNERSRDLILPQWLPTPGRIRFRRAAQRLDEIVYGIIAQRRELGGDRGDLLSMLMGATDEAGERMTDQQLRDEVMTLFLAGHETTANTLAFTWMLLAQNPHVEAALHSELDTVLGGRVPELTDLPHLPYTEKVIKEVLRLYPPAWIIGRQSTREVQVGGVNLPADVGVIMSQWVLHRDARFFPDPDLFIPERWSAEFEQHLPDFAYFPFGGGPRLCIGRSFALQEAMLVLAVVAQQYRLCLVDKQPVELEASVTLRPKHGIRMRLEKLKNPIA